MHIPDLSEYIFNVSRAPIAGVLSVGWLDRDEPFTTGAVAGVTRRKLRMLLTRAQANMMRGWHDCNLCEPNRLLEAASSPAEVIAALRATKRPFASTPAGRIELGDAEIWVPGAGGVVFAAPNLIVHYVEKHRYLPPPQFLAAVDRFDPESSWDAHAECTRHIASLYETKA